MTGNRSTLFETPLEQAFAYRLDPRHAAVAGHATSLQNLYLLERHILGFRQAVLSGWTPNRFQQREAIHRIHEWVPETPSRPLENLDLLDLLVAFDQIRQEQARKILPEPPLQDHLSPPLAPSPENCVEHLLHHLSRAFEPVSSLLQGLYLHGSHATRDHAGDYSDVDLVAILAPGVATRSNALKALRNIFIRTRATLCACDPLSHHSIQILTAEDLLDHPQPRFPIHLLQRARQLLPGEAPLRVGIRSEDETERLDRFWRLASSLRQLSIDRSPTMRARMVKDWMSRVMLLPTLALQAIGESVHKRESFDRSLTVFPDVDWRATDWATSHRSDWGPVPHILRQFPNSLLLGPDLWTDLLTRMATRIADRFTPIPSPTQLDEFREISVQLSRTLVNAVLERLPKP